VATRKWSDVFVRLSLRANFRCEYCGIDFLASPESYNSGGVITSIQEKTKVRKTSITCCQLPNVHFSFKGHWDPGRKPDQVLLTLI
jgi:hypothetical protein